MIDTLHLYITKTSIQARRQTGVLWKKRIEQVGEWSISSLNAPPFAQLPVQKKWTRVHVYLGSALCKFMSVVLPQDIRKPEERTAVARAKLMDKFGLVATDWEVCVDAPDVQRRSVACAMPTNLLASIRAYTSAKHLRLSSITPYVSHVWNVFEEMPCAKETSALLLLESDAFTVMQAQASQIEVIHSLQHQAEPAIIDRELKRIRVAIGSDHAPNIHIALPINSFYAAHLNTPQLTRKTKRQENTMLYPDFTDLCIAHSAPDSVPTTVKEHTGETK